MVVPSPWVWRHDGTLQCGLGAEETLQEAREQLETVIGPDNVLVGEKRTLPNLIITMCGAPTGEVNAFQLTPWGFWLLFNGIVGPIDFRPWVDENLAIEQDGGEVPVPFKGISQARLQAVSLAIVGVAKGEPSSIDELYGRTCRVYNVGDGLTDDYIAERFNVGLARGRIKEMWFG